MSVSKWKYTPACDGKPCPGDCDSCGWEPEEDELISRKAAIDAVIELCKHYTPTKSVKHPHMDFVIEELKWLPSAEPDIPDKNVGDMISKRAVLDILYLDPGIDEIREEMIKNLPSAESEITHCAECIHWKHSAVRKSYCEVFDWVNTAEDFCSFAERRVNE